MANSMQPGSSNANMALIELILQGVFSGLLILGAVVGLLHIASLNGIDVSIALGKPTLSTPEATEAGQSPGRASASRSASATSTPSATVAALPTPTPLPVVDARTYFNLVAPDLSLLLVSLQRNAGLLRSPAPERENWRTEVVAGHEAVQDSYARLSAVEPPDAATEIHTMLLDSVQRCLGIMDALEGDLESVAPQTFRVVADMVEVCSQDGITVMDQIKRSRIGISR